MARPEALDAYRFLLPDPSVRIDRVPWRGSETMRLVRDDLLHPIAGGNKLRKLDALLPKLKEDGVTDIVTCGGAQSAHCAAVAALASSLGMRAHLLLRGEAPEVPTGYTLWSMMFGHVVWVPRSVYADRESMLQRHADTVRKPDRRVHVLPEGGADPLALPGLVRLVWGLVMTLPEPFRTPYRLVADSGTGVTAIGLSIGVALLGLRWEVYGVRLLPEEAQSLQALSQRLTLLWEKQHGTLPHPPNILWADRAPARRFGSIDPEELAACVLAARQTGVAFDPIYTWPAWRYPESFTRKHREHTVVIHTGGQHNLCGIAQRTPFPVIPHG